MSAHVANDDDDDGTLWLRRSEMNKNKVKIL